MRCRLLLLTAFALACAQAVAQTDSDDSIPVMRGLSTPEGKACSFNAKPGEAGYCLRPSDGPAIWLRADDIWTRVSILTQWKSPPSVGIYASTSGKPGETGWRLPDVLAGSPVARFADSSSMMLSAPGQYESFTLFAVARQVPGSGSGSLVSASSSEEQGIGWADGKSVVVRGGPGKTHALPFAGAADFHVLTVLSDQGNAMVFANGRPLNTAPLDLGPHFGVQFVGAPARRDSGGVSALQGFGAMRAPVTPAVGSDIAELIIWPRVLSDEEMRATLRYLRRKYSLDFPVAAPGVMVAAHAASPAPAAAAAAADGGGPPLPGSAQDPLANYPVYQGSMFRKGSPRCSNHALKPGDDGYCLTPAGRVQVWHRADDGTWGSPRLHLWNGYGFSELTQDTPNLQPTLVLAQLGRYPVIRFDSQQRMDLKTTPPLELRNFTLFIVGRRVDTAYSGPIFGVGPKGNGYMFWLPGELVVGTVGAKKFAFFQYPNEDKYHLLELRSDGAGLKCLVNGREVGVQPLPVGDAPFRLGHVGGGITSIASTESLIDRAVRNGFSTSGSRANESSEFSEILIYDRLLEPEEMQETERYLRKKYSLP